jgi:membrane protease YdiL (CAAX protease family)
VNATLERKTGNVLSVTLLFALTALALRTVGTFSFVVPAAGAAGVLLAQPRATTTPSARTTWIAVTLLGAAAFALVRLAMPAAAVQTTVLGLLTSIVAAVAEEIVFRRGLYGALERSGPLAAVVATSLVFGVVHAPMYGWRVVGVDVAAGFVLGWQRWASRGWTSPAVTHVFANVLGAI